MNTITPDKTTMDVSNKDTSDDQKEDQPIKIKNNELKNENTDENQTKENAINKESSEVIKNEDTTSNKTTKMKNEETEKADINNAHETNENDHSDDENTKFVLEENTMNALKEGSTTKSPSTVIEVKEENYNENKRKSDNSESYLLYDDDNDAKAVMMVKDSTAKTEKKDKKEYKPTLSRPRWMEPSSTNNDNRCRQFDKNQKCSYGMYCIYYHVAPKLTQNTYQQIQSLGKNNTQLPEYCIFEKCIHLGDTTWHTAAYCNPNNCIVHYAQFGNYCKQHQDLYWYTTKEDAVQALRNVISYYEYIHHPLVAPDCNSGKKRRNSISSTIIVTSDDNEKTSSSETTNSSKKVKTAERKSILQILNENDQTWHKNYSKETVENFNALLAYRNFSCIHAKIHKNNLLKTNWGKLLMHIVKQNKGQLYLYSTTLKIDESGDDTGEIKDQSSNNNDIILKPCGYGGVEIDGCYYYKSQIMVKSVLYFMHLKVLVECGRLKDERHDLNGKALY